MLTKYSGKANPGAETMATTSQGRLETAEQAHRAFIRAYGLFRNQMEPHFARFGISGSQWGVLRVLQRAEAAGVEGLRLTDIGQRVLVKPPSVTAIVDRMVRMGLLTRAGASDDQRAKIVKLTPAARELMKRVLEQHSKQILTVFGGLSSSEQRVLKGLMEKLAAHLETVESPVALNGQ
jgi:MarR family 2-MHQ and catechol resistance regulon transcriptional repressor